MNDLVCSSSRVVGVPCAAGMTGQIQEHQAFCGAQGCTVHTSVYWAFPPCSDISKLSNPKVNMATPSFCLLKSTIQEPSLTPIFLSTLDSGSIRKSYQLSFQTRQDSDHLPLLLTLVQTIICRAGYTQPPCLWPCRGLQSVTIRQAQHPSHDVCSHHSE